MSMDNKITVDYVRNLGETLGELISQAYMLATFKTASAQESAKVYAAVTMERMLRMGLEHAHNHAVCASFVQIDDLRENDGFLMRQIDRCGRMDAPYVC